MRVLLLIGVSGCGKSTIGRELADRLHGTFLDADDFHPRENIKKMGEGIPLDDVDRFPWLERLVRELEARKACAKPIVLACSALKEAYRDVFRKNIPCLTIIYLRGDNTTIRHRLSARRSHYMKPHMLESQLADLEEPQDAVTVDANGTITEVVEDILRKLT